MKSSAMKSLALVVLCVAVGALFSQPALAQCDNVDPMLNDPACNDCLDQASGLNNNCNANDISIKQIVVDGIIDGCTDPNDTALVIMEAKVAIGGGGTTRYDIGLFLNVEGGSAQTATDQCLRDIFDPAGFQEGEKFDNNQPTDTCNDAKGNVVYLTNTHPACQPGDVDPDCGSAGFAIAFLGPVEIQCTDSAQVGGVVDFSGCVSYVQNSGNVCTNATQAVNLAPSKCGCSRNDVPGLAAPDIVLTKNCDNQNLSFGETSTCTITYQNNAAVAADFISFRDDYDETAVQIVTAMSSNGADTVQDTGTEIRWTPGGVPAAAGNIGPSGDPTASGTLTYDITLLPGQTEGDPIVNEVCAYYQELKQPLCADFTHNVGPNAAVLTGFKITESDGGALVQWRTAAETATRGFQLERWDSRKGEYVAVGEAIGALETSPAGSKYQLVDRRGSMSSKYRIVEFEQGGSERVHETSTVVSRLAAREPLFEMPSAASREVLRATSSRRTRTPASRPARSDSNSAADQLPQAPLMSATEEARPAVSELVIEVSETGVQAIGISELANAFGVNQGTVERRMSRGRLSLTRDGDQVSWWPSSDSSNFLFYGEFEENRVSNTTPYRLSFGNGTLAPTKWLRPASGPALTSVAGERFFEENLLLRSGLVDDLDDDVFYWAIAPGGGQGTVDINVPDAETSGVGELAVSYFAILVQAGAELELFLNGNSLGTESVLADGNGVISFAVPAGTLVSGNNVVSIAARNFAGIGMDVVRLQFSQQLVGVDGAVAFSLGARSSVEVSGVDPANARWIDVTDPNAPILLAGRSTASGRQFRRAGRRPTAAATAPLEVSLGAGSYLLTETHHTPELRPASPGAERSVAPADLLIVTHWSMVDAAEAYAEYRRNQGLRVTVATAQEAFDRYTFSNKDPFAIRDYAEAVYNVSNGELQGLFIIGNGTLDPRNFLGHGGHFVPVALTHGSFGIAGWDRLFADFNEDGVDEISVGRLPVWDPSEIYTYLDKVQGFEAGIGDWTQRDLMLADNSDAEGNYSQDSNNYARPWMRNPASLFLGKTHDKPSLEAALLDSWRDGLRIINYFGHASLQFLAHENLLDTAALDALPSVESNPLFLGLTCNIGRLDFPGFESLGAQLALSANGSVAVVGGGGLSLHTHGRVAAARLLELTQSGVALGEALRTVLNGSGGVLNEALPTIVGDPLLTVQ